MQTTTLAISHTETVLLLAAALLFLVQLAYLVGLYGRLMRHNRSAAQGREPFTDELPPLSVILCVRDEADRLRQMLPSLLEQDYPTYEVIVIDDASTDDTAEVLGQLSHRYPHLYHSFTPNSARYISHKKLALTLGIKASKYEWLVFTETDCRPSSDQWLRLMARNFTPDTQIVLGASVYERHCGWWHKRIAFDHLQQTMRQLCSALSGHPYSGCGRNMAYRKELFFRHKGFSAHLNLRRGEDDLFINQAATSTNTRVEASPGSLVRLFPRLRPKEWREERLNYAATARHYRGLQRYVWGIETFTRVLFHAVTLAALVLTVAAGQWPLAAAILLLWLIRYAVQALVINRTSAQLGTGRRYFFTLPVFDILQPLKSLVRQMRLTFLNPGEFMRK